MELVHQRTSTLTRICLPYQRANYKRDAKAAYETRFRLAYYGAADYPPTKTFQPGLPSTNSVYDDMKTANCM